MKNIALGILSILVVLVAIMTVNTIRHTPPSLTGVTQTKIEIEKDKVAGHLAEAIRFRTVSNQSKTKNDRSQFTGFIDWVATTYPAITNRLDLQRANYSLLYKWQGTDPSLKPILVTAHYDVVPVLPGTENKWSADPFGGEIIDGIIWGRGALDDKSGVIAILEAVTYLLDSGYQPARTIYLSFGHDEEVGGTEGAAAIVALLQEQGVQLLWSLDEGSFVFKDMFPGVKNLIATINVAEKGSVTLDIVASAPGGHSSMPPTETAIGKLAGAITLLENNPVPGGLDGMGKDLFDNMSAYMDFGPRMLFANQWLFKSLVEQQLSSVTFANAMMRTTTAPTMLSGSVKTNVLPIEAIATVNFRIHPRDTIESVTQYVEDLVGSEDIEVRFRGGINASSVSDWQSPGFANIALASREIYGEVVITPGLMIAGSDSRHYGKIADNAFRYNPFIVTPADLTGFHGTNERISIDNLAQGVRTYVQIIRHGGEQ